MSEKVKPLNDRHQMFVEQYLVDLNATAAAKRAGYSEKTAHQQASMLLKRPDIQAAVQEGKQAQIVRIQCDQDYVLKKIMETIERCSTAEPVRDNDGVMTGEWQFKENGVLKGCELLGKHLGLWKDKVEVTGKDGGAIVTKGDMTLTPSEAYERMIKGNK